MTNISPGLQSFSLKGQTALITGASRGIGKACALALAEAGSHICLVLRQTNPETESFATHVRSLGVTYGQVTADLSDLDAVKRVVDEAVKQMGVLHTLVNCAGIQRRAAAELFSESDWDDVLNTNLKVPFLLAQAFARQALAAEVKARIINFGSLMSYQGGFTIPASADASAKGGIRTLTQALSNEWSSKGINVNAICPGYVATDMNEGLLADRSRLEQISTRIPIGRWATPDDFKGVTVFLASPASAYITGICIAVDGGWLGR